MNTIFYSGKIKKTCTPKEVFEKMIKGIKKKGPTKLWSYVLFENKICIDFGDGESETFILEFINNEFEVICKISFEPQEESTSEFISLMDILYSIRNMLSKYEIWDDFGFCKDYIESKKVKIKLRELNDFEKERIKTIFESGITDYKLLLLRMIGEDLKLPEGAEFADYFDPYIQNSTAKNFGDCYPHVPILENWLYLTCEYLNRGRIKNIDKCEYKDFSGLSFSVFAFCAGIAEQFFDPFGYNAAGVKHAQVRIFFREKINLMFEKCTSEFEKCLLAYQVYFSVLDFLGFSFIGLED